MGWQESSIPVFCCSTNKCPRNILPSDCPYAPAGEAGKCGLLPGCVAATCETSVSVDKILGYESLMQFLSHKRLTPSDTGGKADIETVSMATVQVKLTRRNSLVWKGLLRFGS